jgi:hypothetical protein
MQMIVHFQEALLVPLLLWHQLLLQVLLLLMGLWLLLVLLDL